MAEIKLLEYYCMLPSLPMAAPSGCSRFCRLTKQADGAELIVYNSEIDGAENGVPTASVYQVPKDAFDEINAYINEQQIFEKMKNAGQALPGMVGPQSQIRLVLEDGSQATACISVANEVTMLFALRNKCGEPAAYIRGLQVSPFGVYLPQTHRANEKPAANAWKCRACGASGNTGKFCPECGRPKA